MWKMMVVCVLVGCVGGSLEHPDAALDAAPDACEPPEAKAWSRPEIPCNAVRPTDGAVVDGVVIGDRCYVRCATSGPVCFSGSVYSTFTTVDDDTCAVGHVCYCDPRVRY